MVILHPMYWSYFHVRNLLSLNGRGIEFIQDEPAI